MPQFYDSFPPRLQEWALQQSVFFTASAPLRGRHVNLSPKGRPAATFAVLGASRAAYLDLSGSGAETISHVYENGRVTVMFCSFAGPPRILRLFCTGRVVECDDVPRFERVVGEMGKGNVVGTRAVIVLDIWKVRNELK
ncbi:pyridoxamine phosphate oxidase family protein [Biscogniauxia mediterranea]|nr:pyridoxamine phosphate oxidase family protein [Biscogniauxia mediterranea]